MPTASDYIANLQANPTWVNRPDGKGLNLIDHANRPVRDPSGKLFFVPFDAPLLPGAGQPKPRGVAEPNPMGP
jgi:hypothetical protein